MLEIFLKESENDSIAENFYVPKDVPNAKYSIEEKKKYLDEAIRNGGYYGDNGCWNSIMTFPNDKNVYRGRVETLIIKDDKFIFLKFLPRESQTDKRTYTVPGGSFELNMPNDVQAINECMEEARIKVSNIQATGISYKEVKDPPKWAVEKQPVNWNGNYTEVYVGEYDGKYTGHIDKVDEDKFMITGKFYKLDEIFKYLKKEHKEALKVIYPNRFNSGKFVKESVNERNNVSVKQIKGVIKKIRAKVDKDKKPPTGNQNCMLCTWCAEAWFRGYDILPRPIYSPTDKVFDFEGYEIIKSPTKISIKDKNEIKNIISVAGDGSRFYTHMKWKNGNGGHEFILININNDIYVLDAQQGLLENVESSEGSTYFKEVDYSKSYIIRMDNKEFNKPMFKYNNDSYIKDFTEEDKKYVNESTSSQFDQIIEFNKRLNNFEYILPNNGNVITKISEEDFSNYYKLLTPQEFEKYNGGICWDYVAYEAYYFKRYFPNINFETHYQIIDNKKDCPTHTFLIFEYDRKWYWFESSWKPNCGVYGFESKKDCIEYIMQRLKLPQKNYGTYICKFDATDQSIYGINCTGYMNRMMSMVKPYKFINKHIKPAFVYKGTTPEYKDYITESAGLNLYHISEHKLDNLKLTPRIPNNFLVKNGYEDSKTKRISFCKSIDDCLTALSQNCTGKKFYVYKVKSTDNIKMKIPSVKEVPDSKITGEVWVLEPVEIVPVGNIKVIGDTGEDGMTYTYGNNTAELYRWKWSWINKNSKYMTESVIFNEKDIYYNKDKFDSGEINLCFITGFSGSGKSTMASKMEKSGIEKYELDDIVFQFNFSDENLKEYGGMISSFFNGPGKKYRAVKGIDDLKTDKEADDYQANICIDFIDYAKKYASSHKDKKFIVEGVEIFGAYIDKIESLKDYAIYIKGTSLFNSYIRSAKRDSQDAETDFGKFKSFMKMIASSSRFKQYLTANTRLNKIKKQINEYVTESEDKSELTKGFKSKTSNIQYKTLSIDKPEIYDYLKNHFSKNDPMWEGVKDSKTYMDCFINGNNTRHVKRVGEVLINKANDEVIGFEVVEKPDNYLAIEIPDKKYRGYGFGSLLLEDAIKKHGCKKLYVAKDNKIAIKMYTNRGFEITGEFYDGEWWHMELKESDYTDRNSLPNSTFGIPSQRKFPLNDKAHVLAAIRMFNRVDREHEKELAHNIIKAMDKYGIKSDMVGKKNRLQTYLSDEDY